MLDIGGRERRKFKKPKYKVEEWNFTDTNEEYNPDIGLDVTNMHQIS